MAAPPASRPAPEPKRMKTDAAGGVERSLYLPDFCTSRAALVLILIVELTALVLTLARQSLEGDFWADLSRTSLFLLWIALAGTGLLCLAKKQLARVIALVSGCALYIGRTDMIYNMGLSDLFPHNTRTFLFRNVSIGLVITG